MNAMPVDLAQFWADDALAHADNCFSPTAPQVALGIRMSDECVFAELDEAGEPWGHTPRERRIALNKRYNDKSERIVGKRLLKEDFLPEDATFPAVKRIGELFGGRYIWHNETEWLESDIKTPQQLEAQLKRIEQTDIKSWLFPDRYENDCRMIYERYGIRPSPLHHVRGPITLACSIYGAENLIYLLVDDESLAMAFSRAIGDAIIKMAEAMDEMIGGEPARYFSFADDNCCLLNADLYEQFGYPILKRVFERFCPNPSDYRYQHSDSAMGHLLPVLSRLSFSGVNFGPTVLIDEIRRFMPHTKIEGCIAPFTFMGTDRAKLIAEAKRDCEMARQYGKGVNLTTAGSINNGSSLDNMRTVMWAIQTYGRY